MVVNDITKAALLENEQWLTTSLQLRTAKNNLALVGAAPQVLYFISLRFTQPINALIHNCKEMRSYL